MNDTFYDVIIGNGANVSVLENEASEQHTNGQHNDFEKFFDSASQNQVLESNRNYKKKKSSRQRCLDCRKRMQNTILTAMDKMVIPRVETNMRSITGSSAHGPNSEVLYPDRRDFLGIAGNTPFMSASSRQDLNINQDKNDETRHEENFEYGNFPLL